MKSEGGLLNFLSLELGGGSNFVTRVRKGCSHFCYQRNARNQCNKTRENGCTKTLHRITTQQGVSTLYFFISGGTIFSHSNQGVPRILSLELGWVYRFFNLRPIHANGHSRRVLYRLTIFDQHESHGGGHTLYHKDHF